MTPVQYREEEEDGPADPRPPTLPEKDVPGVSLRFGHFQTTHAERGLGLNEVIKVVTHTPGGGGGEGLGLSL